MVTLTKRNILCNSQQIHRWVHEMKISDNEIHVLTVKIYVSQWASTTVVPTATHPTICHSLYLVTLSSVQHYCIWLWYRQSGSNFPSGWIVLTQGLPSPSGLAWVIRRDLLCWCPFCSACPLWLWHSVWVDVWMTWYTMTAEHQLFWNTRNPWSRITIFRTHWGLNCMLFNMQTLYNSS